MSDIVNSVTKLSQTIISQFFSPVTAEEARTANARTKNANISQTDNDIPEMDAIPNIQRRSRGNLKIFQLNTAKKTESGSALSRLMGACRHFIAFVTELPVYCGRFVVSQMLPSTFYITLVHNVPAWGFTKIANFDLTRLELIFWSLISIVAHYLSHFS